MDGDGRLGTMEPGIDSQARGPQCRVNLELLVRLGLRPGRRRPRRAWLCLLLGLSACLGSGGRGSEQGGGLPRHRTVLLAEPELTPDPSFGETAWVEPGLIFDTVLVSWNVDVPRESGVLFQVQVRDGRGELSPWLDLGDWGRIENRPTPAVSYSGGHVEVDTLVLDLPEEAEAGRAAAGRALRVRMRSVGPGASHLALLSITVSDIRGRFNPAPVPERLAMPPGAVPRLAVPFRSQRAAAPALASRVCSPTAVTMVLAAADIRVPLERVAALAFDPTHDLFGVWPRSIQAAYELGLPGFLTRFEGWGPVHRLLEAGVPLVISVRAGPGELAGAPYEETDGHLLVLSGVDQAGDLLVHDPAAPDVLSGVTTYGQEDLTRCWLGIGGTAYVFIPPPLDPSGVAEQL